MNTHFKIKKTDEIKILLPPSPTQENRMRLELIGSNCDVQVTYNALPITYYKLPLIQFAGSQVKDISKSLVKGCSIIINVLRLNVDFYFFLRRTVLKSSKFCIIF